MGRDTRIRTVVGVVVSVAALSCGGNDDASDPGSENGGSGGGGGTAGTPICGEMEARVSVTGGMNLTIPLVQAANITSANENTERWAWGTSIGTYGFFRMIGVGAIPGQFGQPLEGMPLTVNHAVFAPNVGDALGTLHGVAEGSGSVLRRENDQVVVDLRNVATIEGCSGTPAMGELHICYMPGDDCPSDFERGVLDNYSWEDDISSWSLMGNDLRVSVGYQGANLRARLDASGTTIVWAHFGTSIYSRYDGRMLCAGAGEITTMTMDATTYTFIHLRNLAWLEGSGPGQISGCLR